MKKNKTKGEAYIKAYCLFLILVCAFLPFYEKGSFEVSINRAHTPFLDQFFVWITQMGDGVILIFPILILLFVKFSYAIFLALSTIIHILFVHLGKRVFFPGMPRPIEFLAGIELHMVPGVSTHHWNTFPSGHTASIFMLTCALSFLSPKQKWLQIVFLLLAILTGFSRIYLMQHFLTDVLAGAVLGVIAAYSGRWITLKFFSKKKFRKSLLSNRKRKIAKPVME
ncbi:phosphatase PAP2 family protein [Cyclobacterium sp. SYSU L10401]|uniref:phosphatase PAP2 family protein n=1 Tax=Cyclobacterium sp. SYSU L10401 TaxID=2678657 RepID=UPI0013D57AD1|nr:phosphatase PAP2 family protein [Cyclobacterium sp. SYSU L10401]